MASQTRVVTDRHAQRWLVGPGHQPIPLDADGPLNASTLLMPRAAGFGPRYVAYRADRHLWKDCYTLMEVRNFCRGSNGVVRDRRARRGRWLYRLIGTKGGFTHFFTRQDTE